MDLVTIALMLVAVGLGGMAVWLFAQRAGLASQVAAYSAVAARVEADLAAARGEVSELEKRIQAQEAELSDVRSERATLIANLEGQERFYKDELEDAATAAAAERRHLEEQFATRLAGERDSLNRERAILEKQGVQLEQRIRELNEQTKNAFASAAQQALAQANTELVKVAEQKFGAQHAAEAVEHEKRRAAVDQMVKPISDTLKATQEKLAEIEKDRVDAFGRLSEQIRGVTESSASLRDQTGKLVNFLKRPEVRGRYGEIQLERVVELAGMINYADFSTQHSTRDSEGNLLRPDLIVTMPNQREVVVDAKTNINSYLEAVEAPDAEKREACFQKFALDVEQQAFALAKKQYWAQYDGSPEFVVMFIPGDQFLDAALRRRPGLLEAAWESGVILATPSSLIGLLKTVALGWREKRLEDKAQELFAIGKELHERTATAWEHLAKVGDGLNRSVDAYNRAVRSVETRLLPTIRKFEEAGAKSAKELPEMPEVTVRPQVTGGEEGAKGLKGGGAQGRTSGGVLEGRQRTFSELPEGN